MVPTYTAESKIESLANLLCRRTYTCAMRFVTLAAFSCLTLGACQQRAALEQHEYSGPTMGTTFNVKLVDVQAEASLDRLQEILRETLDEFEAVTSTYMEASELTRFNNTAVTDWVTVSPLLCTVVAEAQELSRETNGAFDITVGPLVNLWGFGPASGRDEPPTTAEIEALLPRVGFDKIQADCEIPALRKARADLYIDLSAWAKGYAADLLADVLVANGIANFLVEIGGEVRVQGLNSSGKEWAVAVEKPMPNGREVQTVLNISNTGLATSGDYRNYFEHDGSRYSHTIDPRTGRPVAHKLASVTVIHKSAARADGLATALLVLGPKDGPDLARKLGVEAIFLLRTPQGIEALTSPQID